MRPGKAAAQRQDAVGARPGLVGADAEFGTRVGDILGVIAKRKIVGADDRLLGIGWQIEADELRGGVRRDAETEGRGRDEAIATL